MPDSDSVYPITCSFHSVAHHSSLPPHPLPLACMEAYDPPMQVQLSHPARTVEVKGPKKAKELLRELNLVVEAHLVIKGDDLVTEDEMLYDGDQIEIRPVISGG
jgi:sulfur carrier protein